MRARISWHILMAATIFLSFPLYSKAQNTNGSSSLIFDEATGILHGYSTSDPDYSVSGYYNSWVAAALIDESHDGPEGYGFTYLDAGTAIGPGRVEEGTQAEAEADTQYKLVSTHQVEAIYYERIYLDPPNDPEDHYNDYYNFESVGGFSYEFTHTFHGPGPSILMDVGSRVIDVGTTYDQKRTLVPHHLKIVSDDIHDPTTIPAVCGQLDRVVKYRVVDSNGRGVGKTAVGETFSEPTVSSCTSNAVPATSCSSFFSGQVHPNYTDGSGKFTDTLRVGCPASTDNCGFATKDTWVWCKAPDYSSIRVPLAAIEINVRKRNISVNGRDTVWVKDTEFFPDGSVHEP